MSGGKKWDNGKLRFDLIDPKAEEQLAAVLTYGANKYGADNWRSLDHAEDRYYAAIRRHLSAWRGGELLDPESGLPHMSHVMCNVHFLVALAVDGPSLTAPAPAPVEPNVSVCFVCSHEICTCLARCPVCHYAVCCCPTPHKGSTK